MVFFGTLSYGKRSFYDYAINSIYYNYIFSMHHALDMRCPN